jgi:hypothetical protein
VDFTKLEIAHLPAREKREEEIRLYKQKQAAAAALTDSIDIADRQPVFLKDKGDVLFKQNNFHAAVNAYTKAIELEGEDSMCTLKCRCAHIPELIMFAKDCLAQVDRWGFCPPTSGMLCFNVVKSNRSSGPWSCEVFTTKLYAV